MVATTTALERAVDGLDRTGTWRPRHADEFIAAHVAIIRRQDANQVPFTTGAMQRFGPGGTVETAIKRNEEQRAEQSGIRPGLFEGN